MKIPIIKKIKQKRRKEIAQAQDLVMQEIYHENQEIVLHGGTAIWRCYGGNRFSHDLDFYFPLDFRSNLKSLKQKFRNIGIKVKKLKTTQNSVYSTLHYNERTIQFGGLFKQVKEKIAKQYILVDGTNMIINTLSPVNLLKEKIKAYLDRRKVRDLYDIYYLSGFIKEKKKIDDLLSNFLERYKEPKNKNQLKSLIISGIAPSITDMLKEMRRWAK